jgi:thiamine biosynthesis lipoprotein
MREVLNARHEMMTTFVDIELRGESRPELETVEQLMVAEMRRLVGVFNTYDPASELSRWQAHPGSRASAELSELCEVALNWQRRSEGRFNPAVKLVTQRWREAERTGSLPVPEECAALAERIAEPSFEFVDGRAVFHEGAAPIDLSALAKGFVVDAGVAVAVDDPRCEQVVVNAGGDLSHRGIGELLVAIEDPLRPYDNVDPIGAVLLREQALATSGNARRGFDVAGERFGHLIDPRTGRPGAGPASISVIAPTAVEADVAATALSLMDRETLREFIDGSELAVLWVGEDGERWTSETWPALPPLPER